MIKSLLFLLFSSLLFITCADTPVQRANGTYFGGEIVNPKEGYIILSKHGKVIDTILLDANNQFLYEFTDFEEGLYRFSHREHQLVHIEAGDSVLMRVNTMEFDESLAFSGYGGAKSNLLIDLFLLREQEDRKLTQFYQRQPKEFQRTLDSLLVPRQQMLSDFLAKHQPSIGFMEVANATVAYNNYQRMESYPFSHYVKDKMAFIKQLPEDFYRFRESVNLNNANLDDLYAYQRYLFRYFDHLAFKKYGNVKPYNTISYIHTLEEMKLVDSLITVPVIKDRLLTRAARIFIANNNSKVESDRIFAFFNANVNSVEDKRKVTNIVTSNQKIEAGNSIPDQLVKGVDERNHNLKTLLTKPTVLYFWSSNDANYIEDSHNRIKDLKSKYPEFDYLGISMNTDFSKWKSHVERYHLNTQEEYMLADRDKARRELVINAPAKTIIVDKNGIILNSHTNIYRANFEEELLEYLNQ